MMKKLRYPTTFLNCKTKQFKIKSTLFCLFFLLSLNFSFGQGADCASATSLTIDGTCDAGTISDNTQDAPNITTCTRSGFFRREGWYTFTVTGGPLNINITANSGNRNLFLQLISSTSSCTGLTQIACANDDNTNNSAQTETINATLNNGIYYVKVVNVSGGNNTMNLNSICITTSVENDLCTNATTLNCGDTNISGTTTGTSSIASSTGCTVSNYGVWYTFVGDGQLTTISATETSGWDHEMNIASGNCGSLTNIDCIDTINSTETYTFTTTNGTNYYIYIAHWDSTSTTTGDFTISLSCTAAPTPPANDEPCGAIALTVNPDFSCTNTTSGTVAAATNSGIDACGFSSPDDDVWYSFVATSTAHTVDILNVAGSVTDMYHAVYGGFTAPDCSVAVADNVSCSDPDSSTITGLVVGETYFVQVFTYTATGGQTSTFDICVGTPPPPPANDEPCGAIALTVNPDFSCTSTTSGTVASATDSGVDACGFSSPDDDVWYSFVAINTAHTVDILNVAGSVTDMYHAVYGGFTAPDCSVAVADNVICSDPDSSTITGLVIGETYFVQVFTYTATGGQTSTFDICIGTPPPPPVNDEPCGSISLTVNPDYFCASTTSGTITSATDSGIDSCAGTEDDDVWYHFVATGPIHTVDILNIAGSTTDMYHAVYGPFANANAPNCTNATVGGSNINCSDPNSSTLTGLVTGQTYFVQVFSYTLTAGQNSTFDICIGTPPPPPSNDEPCTATVLTPDGTCIPTAGTVGSATDSGIDACFGTPDNDVWYSFQATDPSHTVTISNFAGSDTDMYLAIYGSYTAPDCNVTVADNLSCEDFDDYTDLTGLTVGDTYFVQVFTYSSGPATTTFDICVTEPCSNSDPINNTPTVCPLIAGEQGVDPFTVDPFDPDPSYSLDCTSPTFTLEAHATIRETDSYIVEQIAYPSPAPDYDFPTFGGVGVQVIADDDVWADTRTNLGFNFCYYGTTYTETLVGANGMITFDSTITPGSSCGYSFNANLPSLAGDLFNETIYGVYHDIDPRGLTGTPIKSRLVGTTPGCRQFMVSWHDIPMFGDATRLYTGMIVLHETTNIIEVFIEEKRIENGNVGPWNNGNAIVGLQGDANAGEAITAPCRNGLDSNWETTTEAWRFVPNGNIIAPDSIEWFSASTGSTVLGTNATLTINTPDTYTAEVTYTSCGSTVTYSDDVVVDQSSKTWNGSINNNWYVHDNWTPSGVPTLSDCVLIPDVALSNGLSPIADDSNIPGTAPIPPALASALNLTVDTNGYIEVLAGTNLQVVDWINLNGTIDIRDTGSLIQVNNGAANVNNNTGNGSINMQRTATIASTYDYIYWSSPVEGFGVSNVSPGSTLIYEWIPTIVGNGVGNYGNWQASTENMINGKGYIIRNVTGTPTPSTPEFVGRPNNGVITKAITRGSYNGADYTGGGNLMATNLDDNWNLVGNPYPSALSADTFISTNAAVITDDVDPSIRGTVYLWRHLATPSNVVNDPFYEDFVYNYNPNDYIAYNTTGSNPPGFNGDIGAGQAFFVLMEHTAPTNSNVIFNNTMRHETLDNTQFYRTNESSQRSSEIEKHRVWLDLISPENTANSILVGYIEGATNNEDRLFDGNELSETSTRFYSIINEEEYSIQGKALPFENTDTVPLGIEIPQDGNYSIAINTLDGLFQDTNQAIYIEDLYTNTIHNLRVNPFSFNIETGTYNDRFILRYDDPSLSIEDYEISGLEIIAPNNSYIKVKSGNNIIKTVIVYDHLGRELINKKEVNSSEVNIDNNIFSEGTYIVKATLSSGKQKVQKVILRRY